MASYGNLHLYGLGRRVMPCIGQTSTSRVRHDLLHEEASDVLDMVQADMTALMLVSSKDPPFRVGNHRQMPGDLRE